jgi:hypothetical protein
MISRSYAASREIRATIFAASSTELQLLPECSTGALEVVVEIGCRVNDPPVEALRA